MKDFWLLPAREQALVRLSEQLATLDREIAQSPMIRYKGKLIKVEDYPCQCDLQDPHQCWNDKHPRSGKPDGYCKCRCHSIYEP